MSDCMESRSEISEIIDYLENKKFKLDFKTKKPNKTFKWIDAAEFCEKEVQRNMDPFLCENYLEEVGQEDKGYSQTDKEVNQDDGYQNKDEEVIFIKPLAPEFSKKYIPFYECYSLHDKVAGKLPKLYNISDYLSTEKEHERMEERWRKTIHRSNVGNKDEETHFFH